MFKRILRKIAKWLLIAAAVSLLPIVVLRWAPAPGSMLMVERWVTERDQPGYQRQYQWTPYAQIPDSMKMAVIAAEDQRFADHYGFDLKAIRAAVEHNMQGGNLRGASTISQQVARNMYLWTGRSWLRKSLEVWFTGLVELCWPKQRILEIYLNIAEWGDGVFGLGAASRYHFGIPASQLSGWQSALLASSLPSPLKYNPASPAPHLIARAKWNLGQQRMLGGTNWLAPLE